MRSGAARRRSRTRARARRHRAAAGKLRHQRRRIGHVGGVDQPQQRHRRRLVRVGRDADVGQALEQHLPQAVERAPAESRRRAPRAASRSSADCSASSAAPALARVTAWSDSISPRSSAAGLDAERMRLVELAERRRGIAGQHASRAAGGCARGRPGRACRGPRSAVTLPSPCAIAWSRIDRPSRAEPSAARAITVQRLVLDLDAFGLGDIGEMRGELARPGCGAGRTAGSATGPSPAPCSTSVVANRNFTCAGGSSSVFSKRVEGVLRQHVDFVDDVDLVARARPRRSAPPR